MSKKSSGSISPTASTSPPPSDTPKCGIIMPISAIGTYTAVHWKDVKGIFQEAIGAAGFESDLVSESEDTRIIQSTIVHNLYNNPIVVCDVSGKNPNVMFELGIRLTFDKPTVVIKDNDTDYSFDTSSIKHLEYPRDLHYHQIGDFRERLTTAVKATHEAGKNPDYSAFLKHFGQFVVPKLEQKEVSSDEFIIQRLEELTESVSRLNSTQRKADLPAQISYNMNHLPVSLKALSSKQLAQMRNHARLFGADTLAETKGDKLYLLLPENWSAHQSKVIRFQVERFLNELLASRAVDSGIDSSIAHDSDISDELPS
jgi:hypothetical protein